MCLNWSGVGSGEVLYGFPIPVLCFGHNLMLLETKQWILGSAFSIGLRVQPHDLERVAEGGRFDLLILCILCRGKTFPQQLTSYATYVLGLKVLALSSDTTAWDPLFSDQIAAELDGPRALLQVEQETASP
jgi:hypothetical protein